MTWQNTPLKLRLIFFYLPTSLIWSKFIHSRTTTEELDSKTTTPITSKTTITPKTTTPKTTTTMAEEKITTTQKPDLDEMESTTVFTPKGKTSYYVHKSKYSGLKYFSF